MAWRSLLPFLASALAAIGFGCANVKVQKVPVADRIAETDNHLKGFRYYLNRPYLAVTRKVPISTTYIPTAIAAYYPQFPNMTTYEVVLVSQIPKDGRFEVYDSQGQPQPKIDAKSKNVVLISAPDPGKKGRLDLDVASNIITDAFKNSFDEYVKMKKMMKTIKMDPTATEYSKVVGAIIGTGTNSLTEDLAASSDNNTIAQRAVDRGLKVADDLLKNVENVAPTFSTDKRQKMIDDIVAKLDVITSAAPPSPLPGVASTLVYTDSGQTDSKKDPVATPPAPPDAFQIAFLPDFEEQYAIHNCNFLAVTKYKYTFRNGTELVSMAGSYDATDVPVKILETVGKLVEAAGAVGKAKLGGGVAKADLTLINPGGGTANFWIRTERAIEPGLYRIQKSWERVQGTKVEEIQSDHACGLLSDVGLPIVTSVSVISKEQHDKETQTLYK